MSKKDEDLKMTRGKDTKFAHPSNVALLTTLGWKPAKPEPEGK